VASGRVLNIAVVFIWAILLVQVCFAQQPGKHVSFSGAIEGVSKDAKYVIIYERRVFLSGAAIVDESGSPLKAADLKERLYVKIDALQESHAVHARRITVIKAPRVPVSRIAGPKS
jgi:hypothetical protein